MWLLMPSSQVQVQGVPYSSALSRVHCNIGRFAAVSHYVPEMVQTSTIVTVECEVICGLSDGVRCHQ